MEKVNYLYKGHSSSSCSPSFLSFAVHCDLTSADFMGSVIIIGDQGTGKTSFLNRFTRNEFQYETKSTTGVEFAIKSATIGTDEIRGRPSVLESLTNSRCCLAYIQFKFGIPLGKKDFVQ
jgi:hypothetical protein